MTDPYNRHTVALVDKIPWCDMNAVHGSAVYDARTVYGSWAYLCENCYSIYGVGLGLGKGQRLVKR